MSRCEKSLHEVVDRYDLWYIPEYPIDEPWVRTRDGADSWRINLLDNIRENGMRWPIVLYGHSPKGAIIDKYRDEFNAHKDERIYVMIGTNRWWCLKELGYKTFPAILSLNKGEQPKYSATKITPHEFAYQYAPLDARRVWVQEHGYGYTPRVEAHDEFR